MSLPEEEQVQRDFARPSLPWVLLLFFGSGCAALIYEIVWFQMLELVIGSSAISIGVLLGTFMGGMCLGSLGLARFVPRRIHPLRVYACLEAGVGAFGLVVLCLVPHIGRLYAAGGVQGFPGLLLRGLICAASLLPPTVLMGATLPAASRWVEATPKGVSWLGFFYAGNIAGGVSGCLLAGFYLLRLHDMAVATYVAVGFNWMVAAIGFCMAAETSYCAVPESPMPRTAGASFASWPIYLTIALSGFCALGAEVVWTRLLSLMLGATVYTFSIILAVFLVGLGIGSSAGSFVAREVGRSRWALAACQWLLTVAIAWAAWMLARSLPFWPINPSLSRSAWYNFQLDLVRCAWAILPAACLWGASFPLALAAASAGGLDPGRLVGKVYAANTLGAILGAVSCSLLLLGWIGTQHIQQVLVCICALAGFLAVVPVVRRSQAGSGQTQKREAGSLNPQTSSFGLVASFSLAVIVMAAFLVWTVPKVPWGLIAYGRYLATKSEVGTMLYVGEGANASVAVTELSSGVRTFHVSGKVEASTDARDMRLQRMLGHLPALVHPKPRSVLVVGCGAGVTAGSFLTHPGVERIVICEIEPLIPKVVARFFGEENYDVLSDPRVRLVYDDARHYILTTREKFDIITSDPIHPWVKGAATLYTKEYFELCMRHLNPGGLVTQWVPLYESNLAVVKSEIATFFEAFPGGTLWSNDENGEGYDLVLMGSAEREKIDLDRVQSRLTNETYLPVLKSLRNVGCRSGFSLLASYAGEAGDLKPWLQHAEINRDGNLRLQYLAGMGLNYYEHDLIYSDLLVYRRFPDELFIGSESQRQALKYLITAPSKAK